MRRFLSWIELIIFSNVWLVLIGKCSEIGVNFYTNLYYNHKGLFWLIVLFGGTITFLIGYLLIVLGSAITVLICQKIEHSKKGIRYYVIGIMWAFLYSAELILIISGILSFSDNLYPIQIICDVCSLIYSILIVYFGISITKSDGGPLSKKERLLKKLSKIEEKENKKNNITE